MLLSAVSVGAVGGTSMLILRVTFLSLSHPLMVFLATSTRSCFTLDRPGCVRYVVSWKHTSAQNTANVFATSSKLTFTIFTTNSRTFCVLALSISNVTWIVWPGVYPETGIRPMILSGLDWQQHQQGKQQQRVKRLNSITSIGCWKTTNNHENVTWLTLTDSRSNLPVAFDHYSNSSAWER